MATFAAFFSTASPTAQEGMTTGTKNPHAILERLKPLEGDGVPAQGEGRHAETVAAE